MFFFLPLSLSLSGLVTREEFFPVQMEYYDEEWEICFSIT